MRTAVFAGLGVIIGTAACLAAIIHTTTREDWFAGQ